MEITQHPAFATFALCASFLVLKMMAVGHISGIWRIRKLAYLNREDAQAFSQIEETRQEEDPDIARTLRAHRNDLESTLPFLAIGLVYLAVDRPTDGHILGHEWGQHRQRNRGGVSLGEPRLGAMPGPPTAYGRVVGYQAQRIDPRRGVGDGQRHS